tara:strand:- start:3279 stop:3848 length:570 start_codon:yes stop_codon:yes gene_type:complete
MKEVEKCSEELLADITFEEGMVLECTHATSGEVGAFHKGNTYKVEGGYFMDDEGDTITTGKGDKFNTFHVATFESLFKVVIPSEGVRYTEDMLGEGIVPTIGMIIPLEDGDSEVMAVRFCQELFTLVLETKGGWVTMGELVFPKVKTLREVVIEEMITTRDSVIGAQSDEDVMGKLYDTMLRVTIGEIK